MSLKGPTEWTYSRQSVDDWTEYTPPDENIIVEVDEEDHTVLIRGTVTQVQSFSEILPTRVEYADDEFYVELKEVVFDEGLQLDVGRDVPYEFESVFEDELPTEISVCHRSSRGSNLDEKTCTF